MFICFVNNEAVLTALFKLIDDELTFAEVMQVARETEEFARVAKEMVYGGAFRPSYKVGQPRNKANPHKGPTPKAKDTPEGKVDQSLSKGSCCTCGKKNHTDKNCNRLMTSAIIARRRDTCNQFACPKEGRTLESGTTNNWIRSKR